MAAGTFVVAATDGRRARAQELLAAQPQIAADPWAALVLGERFEGDPNRAGGIPRRDYAGVAEALAAAGCPVEPRLLDVAEGPLRRWLTGRAD